MSEQQSLSTGLEVLKLIGAGGIGGAVACIGNWFVNKKLQDQKHEHEKRIIEYTSLHDKQAQIIGDFYAQLNEAYCSIEHLMRRYRVSKVGSERRKPIDPHSLVDLTVGEQQAIDAVESCNRKLFEFYKRNKIYFSLAVCALTNTFCNKAFYLADTYECMIFKNEDGHILVTSEMKEVWDTALETIPKLLTQLEKEFRDILGV